MRRAQWSWRGIHPRFAFMLSPKSLSTARRSAELSEGLGQKWAENVRVVLGLGQVSSVFLFLQDCASFSSSPCLSVCASSFCPLATHDENPGVVTPPVSSTTCVVRRSTPWKSGCFGFRRAVVSICTSLRATLSPKISPLTMSLSRQIKRRGALPTNHCARGRSPSFHWHSHSAIRGGAPVPPSCPGAGTR